MNKDGTYGDHITLQVASNIFNIQITVHSSLRVEANTIISLFTVVGVDLNLGHFAEGQGNHYVCLEEEDNAAENCSNEMQENQEVWNEEENETEKAKENNDKKERKRIVEPTERTRTAKAGACDGIYKNQYENDNQQRRRYLTTFETKSLKQLYDLTATQTQVIPASFFSRLGICAPDFASATILSLTCYRKHILLWRIPCYKKVGLRRLIN